MQQSWRCFCEQPTIITPCLYCSTVTPQNFGAYAGWGDDFGEAGEALAAVAAAAAAGFGIAATREEEEEMLRDEVPADKGTSCSTTG